MVSKVVIPRLQPSDQSSHTSPNKNTKVSNNQQPSHHVTGKHLWSKSLNLSCNLSLIHRQMLRIHPASRAATHYPAMPLALPTVMTSGTKWAPTLGYGVIWNSTVIFRALPRTAALMPLHSLPPKAAQPPPLVPPGPRIKSHGRKIQQAAREHPTLHLQHRILCSPLEAVRPQQIARLPFYWVLMVALTACVMPPPSPGVLLSR